MLYLFMSLLGTLLLELEHCIKINLGNVWVVQEESSDCVPWCNSLVAVFYSNLLSHCCCNNLFLYVVVICTRKPLCLSAVAAAMICIKQIPVTTPSQPVCRPFKARHPCWGLVVSRDARMRLLAYFAKCVHGIFIHMCVCKHTHLYRLAPAPGCLTP